MAKVQDLMTQDMLTAKPEETLEEVRSRMVEEGISALPVLDGEELVGIVTSTDLMRAAGQDVIVGKIMSDHVYTLPPYAGVHLAARIMRNHSVHHVVVTKGKEVVGIVASYDLLELVEDHRFTMKGAPTTPRRRRGRRRKREKALAEARQQAANKAPDEAPPEEVQRDRLNSLLASLSRRSSKVEAYRRREGGIEADFAEQAVTRQNDEVLDALSREGRQQLTVISEALERMDEGSYGTCADCSKPIGAGRLDALPYAVTCIDCARKREKSAT
jgi:RNA polymerase-binding transcription factor DksA